MRNEVLSYLSELSGGKRGRVSFTSDDALPKIGISKKELNKILLSLQEEGIIRIIRIPPSPEVREWLYKRLNDLTGLFITGELSRDEYLEKWKELQGITEGLDLAPLSSVNPWDLIAGLERDIAHIEKLVEKKDEISPDIYDDLSKRYKEEFLESLELTSRYLKAVDSLIRNNLLELSDTLKKLEIIKADALIKGSSADETPLLERISSIANRFERISKVFLDGIVKDDIKKLEGELRNKEEEYSILNARALVEESDYLASRARALKEEIDEMKKKLTEMKKEISDREKKEEMIKEILRRAKKLKDSGLIDDRDVKVISDAHEMFTRIKRAISEYKKIKTFDSRKISEFLGSLKEYYQLNRNAPNE